MTKAKVPGTKSKSKEVTALAAVDFNRLVGQLSDGPLPDRAEAFVAHRTAAMTLALLIKKIGAAMSDTLTNIYLHSKYSPVTDREEEVVELAELTVQLDVAVEAIQTKIHEMFKADPVRTLPDKRRY